MVGVVVAGVILLAVFYLLAVVTEQFFVPAIDKVASRLKMSSDAAGATLLAMGSSAPEFFTALFAVLGMVSGAHADIGAGAIVGSAIFNVLVIVGVAAMFQSVKLQWQPVIRDLVFYIFSIVLLLLTFWDGRIVWYEAAGLLLVYGVYVFTVIKWRKWLKYEDTVVEAPTEEKQAQGLTTIIYRLLGTIVLDVARWPRFYGVSFVLSLLVIAGLSWVLVEQVVYISAFFHIHPVFLALTVLAVGTSIPDLIGSVVVARQGRGDMAVSNAVGSNIFDILFGLGVPWLIALLVMQEEVTVGTENLLSSAFLLFASVVAILFLLLVRNWRIGHKSGIVLVLLYVGYVAFIAWQVFAG